VTKRKEKGGKKEEIVGRGKRGECNEKVRRWEERKRRV
jgi:hypothetical protein